MVINLPIQLAFIWLWLWIGCPRKCCRTGSFRIAMKMERSELSYRIFLFYIHIVRCRRYLIYCILCSKAVHIYKLWRCHYQISSYTIYNIQFAVHADPMRHEVVLVCRRALRKWNCWVENFESNAKSWHVQRWEWKLALYFEKMPKFWHCRISFVLP